jgi:hypothetical protein
MRRLEGGRRAEGAMTSVLCLVERAPAWIFRIGKSSADVTRESH